MDLEQAERFAAAAEDDYVNAVFWYVAMARGKAEGPEDMVQPRADVLATRQVLELARLEMRGAQQDEREREAARDERGP